VPCLPGPRERSIAVALADDSTITTSPPALFVRVIGERV
jgi:hypothetical protein